MGRKLGALILAMAVFAVDRWLKVLVSTHMVPGQSIAVFPPVLWITYITNSGAAFSMFRRGGDPVFIVMAMAILVALAIFIIRQPSLTARFSVGAGLLAGGTAGNLWDRIVSGRVVDYIHFRFWAIFNLADAAIVVGIILIVWDLWRKDQERGAREP